MNSKKKARTSLHSSTSSQEITTTPKTEPAKHNLLTSCRRVGLNKKRNKSLGASPIPTERNQDNTDFVNEDLKKITEPTIKANEVEVNFASELITKLSEIPVKEPSKHNSLSNKSQTILKKRRNYPPRKRKQESDEERATISNLSQNSSSIDSPSLNIIEIKENFNSERPDNKTKNDNIPTIPVRINLTRCDLVALKINLKSSERNKLSSTPQNIQENKENLPTVPLEEIVTSMEVNNENIEAITNKEIIEECTNEKPLEKIKETILKPNNNVPVGNNSLEDNSDASDFYPDVRRKKKKVLTNKQRNVSKPGPSQQKDTTNNKRRSTNNTPCYSDSDDDFVATPVRRDRKTSRSEANSQNSVKEETEKSPKKKLKMKKPVEDDLNKTGHIRISENKSYTIIHKDNCVSYVKSFDNDVNFKVTESDDNQQLPVRNSVELPNKSMIIERKDYLPKKRSDSRENAEMLLEMPSIFTDVMNNLDSVALELDRDKEKMKLQEKNYLNKLLDPQKSNNEPSQSKEIITVIKTARLQTDNTSTEQKKDDKPTEQGKDKINSSEEEDSSEDSESNTKDSETTDSESKNNGTKKPLIGPEIREMNVEQLTEELATLEATVKKKQERLESLQRISVYKENHNLEELRAVTLQIKSGCQKALVDLVLSLKEKSHANFTMATLLEFMKIPNELVGYDESEDKFT